MNLKNNIIFEKTNLSKYGSFENITFNLIDNIMYSDFSFKTRLENEENIMTQETFQNLFESIKLTGLLNPVYLLEKSKDNYVIISGWRRLLALRELYKIENRKIFYQKAIILRNDTPLEVLENISIDENTKRKDLSLLELSYKFNRLSSVKGITIEECLKKFNIGKSQFHAIKKAIDFHPIIKETMLESVGPIKADLLNKILEKLLLLHPQKEAYSLLNAYSKKTREDLKNTLKSLDNTLNQKTNFFEIKKNNNITILKIRENLTDEDHFKIEVFFKDLLKK
ncbi:MAG: ParB/RepB/Spo0J family partition protein [Cetobacterium sp.]|uniref:ParB/RepB/Spo0J family partition protein n=1 Tax=Cetobacterium sp. TaxID=2071632 RepID=UPI003EE6D6AC